MHELPIKVKWTVSGIEEFDSEIEVQRTYSYETRKCSILKEWTVRPVLHFGETYIDEVCLICTEDNIHHFYFPLEIFIEAKEAGWLEVT